MALENEPRAVSTPLTLHSEQPQVSLHCRRCWGMHSLNGSAGPRSRAGGETQGWSSITHFCCPQIILSPFFFWFVFLKAHTGNSENTWYGQCTFEQCPQLLRAAPRHTRGYTAGTHGAPATQLCHTPTAQHGQPWRNCQTVCQPPLHYISPQNTSSPDFKCSALLHCLITQ